jgi:hypothetical protein
MFITAKLIPARGGGGQQNHRRVLALRGGEGGGDGFVQCAGHVERHAVLGQSLREDRSVTADQHGTGNPGKVRHQRHDAAFLAHAAGDPDQPVVADQCALRRVGVGRFAVVDERHAIDGDDALLPVRQSRIRRDPGHDLVARQPEEAGDRDGGGGVLRVVRAGQGNRVRHAHDRTGRITEHTVDAVNIGRSGTGHAHDFRRPRAEPFGHRARTRILDTHHREVAVGLTIEDPPFRQCVTRHVPMAIDMIRAEIEHRRRIEANGMDSLQHV